MQSNTLLLLVTLQYIQPDLSRARSEAFQGEIPMLRLTVISSLAGGILVFLTGQAEVHSLCRRLRKAFPFQKNNTAGNAVE